MNAYAETYLPSAMETLSEAVDYAVNGAGYSPEEFMDAFLASGLAEAWETGSPKVLAGLSGTELVREAFRRVGIVRTWPEPLVTVLTASPEYWAGWVLAYYQWRTAHPFAQIRTVLPLSEIIGLYHPLHEAGEDCFADRAEAILNRLSTKTALRCFRERAGLSQSRLAALSGVNIRSIQQYEQRTKDISKAAVETVRNLARALGCRIEDLV